MNRNSQTFFQQLAESFYRYTKNEEGDAMVICPCCQAIDSLESARGCIECNQCKWRDQEPTD